MSTDEGGLRYMYKSSVRAAGYIEIVEKKPERRKRGIEMLDGDGFFLLHVRMPLRCISGSLPTVTRGRTKQDEGPNIGDGKGASGRGTRVL